MLDVYGHTADNLANLGDVIRRTNERKILKQDDGLLLPYRFECRLFDAKLLRWLDVNTTGRFYRGLGSIMFSDDVDAMMYKLRFQWKKTR